MSELKKGLQEALNNFTRGLQKAFGDNLLSVILYGSGASNEFVEKRSNLNLLVVLKNADLENLSAASGLIKRYRYRFIQPLFFSEEYLKKSTDVFPIEFLDMKENYRVLLGRDVLKDAFIDTKNLRFQCEQELKAKLISLRQLYLGRSKDTTVLLEFLLKSFTSILHIVRNVLRLKGKQPPYTKEAIINEVNAEFCVDTKTWERLLAAKGRRIRLHTKEIDLLFKNFVRDLEKIINIVDSL
jgi:predicted nucleotidyltransferase